MQTKIFFVATLFILLSSRMFSQEILQWRGTERTGIYHESNLLRNWPEAGPALIWECDSIGNGYGSPIITTSTIYVNGEIDTISYLYALTRSGKFRHFDNLSG